MDSRLFLGILGGCGRGGAKKISDIDPVIIFQHCGKDEILKYRAYIDTLLEQRVCEIYHASSHNILHARNWSVLPELYKSARFTIRMKHYLQTGVYVSAFRELTAVVDEEERTILEAQNPITEDDAFMLLEWASKTMRNINTN